MSQPIVDFDQWWEKEGRHSPGAVWWMEKFRERQELLYTTFGATSPKDKVFAFFWDDAKIRIPGACAMTFPPRDSERSEWFTITNGLAQPQSPQDVTGPGAASGYGWEFALLTKEKTPWRTDLLKQLMTYVKMSRSLIRRGDRIPVGFFRDKLGDSYPWIKAVHEGDPTPVGEARALLFWPYMQHPGSFTTSVGTFGIMIATTITGTEWEMAKQTSSVHLLLLLFRAGIGQMSDPDRRPVTEDAKWLDEWHRIRSLATVEAERLLADYAV